MAVGVDNSYNSYFPWAKCDKTNDQNERVAIYKIDVHSYFNEMKNCI